MTSSDERKMIEVELALDRKKIDPCPCDAAFHGKHGKPSSVIMTHCSSYFEPCEKHLEIYLATQNSGGWHVWKGEEL